MIQENLAIPTFYIQGFDITYCKFYGGFIINMLLISDYYCFSKNKTNTIFCFKKEEEAMTKLNELNELLRE
jgi:hypothetical protein